MNPCELDWEVCDECSDQSYGTCGACCAPLCGRVCCQRQHEQRKRCTKEEGVTVTSLGLPPGPPAGTRFLTRNEQKDRVCSKHPGESIKGEHVTFPAHLVETLGNTAISVCLDCFVDDVGGLDQLHPITVEDVEEENEQSVWPLC